MGVAARSSSDLRTAPRGEQLPNRAWPSPLWGASTPLSSSPRLPLAVIWLLTRQPGPRRRSLMGWWVICVVLACFWWSVATVLQGKYGYNYLPYTETATITTSTGSVFDALRGTSFWQNFDDVGGPLIPGGWTLVTSWVAIVATTLVTALGLAGLARRIPERLFLVATLSFGVFVIAIGYGGALGSPLSSSVINLLSGGLGPLRNVSKFSPLITLPLALGLTSLVSTVSLSGQTDRWPNRLVRKHWRSLIGSVAVVAVVFAAIPFWQLQIYPAGGFAAIPSYWTQAANWLDSHQGHQTALLVPGANFAEYTWGSPQDEPLSVLASTSITVRSIIPLGSDGNTDMLSAVEDALATGSPQPGLAEYLSRSGIDFVVERNDLELKSDRSYSSRAGSPGTQRDSRARSSCRLRSVPAPLSGRARRPTGIRLEVIRPPSARRDLQGRTIRFRSPVVSCVQSPRRQWIKRFVAATGRVRSAERAGRGIGQRSPR